MANIRLKHITAATIGWLLKWIIQIIESYMEFRERPSCPSCNETTWTSVWSGRFSDPRVSEFLGQFHYSCDYASALGDQEFDLVKCANCGMMYHRLVMSDAAIQKMYSEWTDSAQVREFEATHGRAEDFQVGIYRTKLILRLKKLLERRFSDPIRLLDFGCGNGQTIAQASMFGFDAQGIDVSLTRAKQASILNCQVYSNLGAFDRLGGGKVHCVILEQVLEHLTEPREILSALHDRMEPGGILYIAVPNCANTTVPRDFDSFHKLQPIEHVNAFTPESLSDLVQNSGFSSFRWPSVFVSVGLKGALRTMAGKVYRPKNTEQFFYTSD